MKADRFGTLRAYWHTDLKNTPGRLIIYAKGIYSLLWGHANIATDDKGKETWITDEISLSFIARCCGCSVNTAVKAVQCLEEEGLISRIMKGAYKSRGSVYQVRHIPKDDQRGPAFPE